jgi:hypothetical protein
MPDAVHELLATGIAPTTWLSHRLELDGRRA